jgi:hypothetical protein
MTTEKLRRRKYKKERRNEEANSHVKCRVPAEVLGIPSIIDASVCFPFPSLLTLSPISKAIYRPV